MSNTGNNIVCGTSTTGAGTLTLAACPAAVGGTDPVQAFGTSGVFLVPYILIEYTDSTLATPKNEETGQGTLTLAAAITSATLARTTINTTTVAGTYNDITASAITIVTAAAVLIFIGPVIEGAYPPALYFDTAGDNKGVGGLCFANSGTSFTLTTSATVYWFIIDWPWSKALTQATTRVQISAGGTGSLNFALFEIGTNGRPGRRLINFGNLGDPASASGTILTTSALGTAVRLHPGRYFGGLLPVFTSTAPQVRSFNGLSPYVAAGALGTTNLTAYSYATVASGDLNDPPTLTNWTQQGNGGIANPLVIMK